MKITRNDIHRKALALVLTGALLLGILPLQRVSAEEGPSSTSGQELNNPTTDSEGVTTWDCVYFGNYWQSDTNGDGIADTGDDKERIRWRVLSVDGDDVFLLSDKSLGGPKYNNTYVEVTWETCTIRSWLNGYGAGVNVCKKDYTSDNFLNYAFTSSEQEAIKTVPVVNENNPKHGTKGGNDTMDRVFLLSIDEVTNLSYGFPSTLEEKTKTRQVRNTAYAKAQGAWAYDKTETDDNGVADWYLRSPGMHTDKDHTAAGVGHGGYIILNGYDVCGPYSYVAVRPALHLNLSASSDDIWSYAGKVTSEGEEIAAETLAPNPTESSISTPTIPPTESPAATQEPTKIPKPTPTQQPTESPTSTPTIPPTKIPEPTPTQQPTESPISTPTIPPTESPAATQEPTETSEPTPTPVPTQRPSLVPTETPAATKSPAPDKHLSAIMDGLGVSEEVADEIQKMAAELDVADDTILVTGQTILSQKTDEDIKGAYFARIQAKVSQITQNNIKLSWNKVKGADGYEVYGNRCNTKKWIYEYKRMKTITNSSKKSFIDRKCKKGTYYKYMVRAYKIIDGKKVTIAVSKTIHVTTAGGENGNAKSVWINKKKLSLKKGKTYRIQAKEIQDAKPLRHHREVSYESGNPEIATVSKRGVVRAKKKGSCTIFAYAQNGKYRKIKVRVKI